ncbi:MAG: mechanosensitive ion channel domain-containing protein [Desulfohalobiaceae bacterium]
MRGGLSRSSLLICIVLLLGISGFSQAFAQQQEPAAETAVSEESLNQLLQDLEDPERLERLKQDLRALLAARQSEAEEQARSQEESGLVSGVLQATSQRMQVLNQQLAGASASMLQIPVLIQDLLQQARDPAELRIWGEMLGKVVLVLLLGLIAERVVRRLLRRVQTALMDREQDNRVLRGLFFLARSVLEIIPIAAFAAAAYGLLPLLEPRDATKLLALTLVNAHVLVKAILLLARVVLVPGFPELRLLPLQEESVQYLQIWVRRLAGLAVYGYFILEGALLLGLPGELQAFLLKLLGLALTAMAIVLVMQNRVDVAKWLREGRLGKKKQSQGPQSQEQSKVQARMEAVGALRRRLADVWHVLAIIVILGLYLTWALEIEGGFSYFAKALLLSGLVLAVASGLQRLAHQGVDRLFRISEGVKAAYPGLEARSNRYQPILRQALRGVIYLVAALAVLQAWGLSTLGWLFSPQGGSLISDLLILVLIIGAAFLLWELISAKIEKILAQEDQGKVSSRKLTLLPLLRNVVRIVLILIAGMIVLTQLDINIAPLLAGAGVVGLAIGFGAQTLVRDVITGAFLLMEDSIAVGDWVEAGGHSGGVEKLTVRTVTLRDLTGTVHVVPFGDVTSVTNYNREFGYALIDAGVAYREDYGHVVQALQDVAVELRQDETWGPDILGDLEVFGLNNLADSAVEIRVRLKTRPLRQFAVRRAFLQRMKRAFDERGIEIPFPHRTIWFGADKDGSAPPMRVLEEDRPAASSSSQETPAPEQDDDKAEVEIASEADVAEQAGQDSEEQEKPK